MAELEDRYLRRLMRQRGAGPRPITTNFNFVFQAGPIQATGTAPSRPKPVTDAPTITSSLHASLEPPHHASHVSLAKDVVNTAPAPVIEPAVETANPTEDAVVPKKKRKIRKSEDTLDWFVKKPKVVKPAEPHDIGPPVEHVESVATIPTPHESVGETKPKRKLLVKRSTVAKTREKKTTESTRESEPDLVNPAIDVEPVLAELQASEPSTGGTKRKRQILVKRTTATKSQEKKPAVPVPEEQVDHVKISIHGESIPLEATDETQPSEPSVVAKKVKRTVSKAKKTKEPDFESAEPAVARTKTKRTIPKVNEMEETKAESAEAHVVPSKGKRTVSKAEKPKEIVPIPEDPQGEDEDELSNDSLQNIVTSKTKSTKRSAQQMDSADSQIKEPATKKRVKAAPRKTVAKEPLPGEAEAEKDGENVPRDGEIHLELDEVTAKVPSDTKTKKSTKTAKAVDKADVASKPKKGKKAASRDTQETATEPAMDVDVKITDEDAIPGHRIPLKERSSNSSPCKPVAVLDLQDHLEKPHKPTKRTTTTRKTIKRGLQKDASPPVATDEIEPLVKTTATTDQPEQPQKSKSRKTAPRSKTSKDTKSLSMAADDVQPPEPLDTKDLDFALFNDAPAEPVKKSRNVKKRTYNDDSELDLDQMLDGIASMAAIAGHGNSSLTKSKGRTKR